MASSKETSQLACLQKRYWVFFSASYEPCMGLADLRATYDTFASALLDSTKTAWPEWVKIVDTHEGREMFFDNSDQTKPVRKWRKLDKLPS